MRYISIYIVNIYIYNIYRNAAKLFVFVFLSVLFEWETQQRGNFGSDQVYGKN